MKNFENVKNGFLFMKSRQNTIENPIKKSQNPKENHAEKVNGF